MPLIQGKSKKSLSKNVATEMDAGKPQKQALAIAFQVQHKNKKKMAKGGEVRAGSERPTADKDERGQTHMLAEGGEVRRAGGTPPTADQGQTQACPKCGYAHDSSQDQAGTRRPTADNDEESQSPGGHLTQSGADRRGGGTPPTADMEERTNAPYRNQDTDGGVVRAGSTRPTADEDERGLTEMLAFGGDIEGEDEDSHVGTLAEAIAKRLAKHMMADGGEVADSEREGPPKHKPASGPLPKMPPKKGHDDGLDEHSEEHGNLEDDLSYDALGEEQFDDDQLSEQPDDSNEKDDDEEKDDEDEHDSSIVSSIKKRAKGKK